MKLIIYYCVIIFVIYFTIDNCYCLKQIKKFGKINKYYNEDVKKKLLTRKIYDELQGKHNNPRKTRSVEIQPTLTSLNPPPSEPTLYDDKQVRRTSVLKSGKTDPEKSIVPPIVEPLMTLKKEINFKDNGEYSYNLLFSDGTKRVEIGEFKIRDGRQVLVISGLYAHVNKKSNKFDIFLYVYDENGYHEIKLPTSEGIVSYRPEFGPELNQCNEEDNNICLHPSILPSMVG